MIQTKYKLIEETFKLSQLELVDKGSVNQLASDVKNQLEELMKKPIPELKPNVERNFRKCEFIITQFLAPVTHNINPQNQNQLISSFNSQQNSQNSYGFNEIKNQAQYDGHGEPKSVEQANQLNRAPLKDLKDAASIKIKNLRTKYQFNTNVSLW